MHAVRIVVLYLNYTILAMNQAELSALIASSTDLSVYAASQAISALHAQLNAEGLAQRAVVWNDFGTFWPRQIDGLRKAVAFNGRTLHYDNWKLVPEPTMVSQAQFAARASQRAGLPVAQLLQVLAIYQAQIIRILRRGGAVYFHGLGSYKVGKRNTRSYVCADGSPGKTIPAHLTIVFKSTETGAHQKLEPMAGLLRK